MKLNVLFVLILGACATSPSGVTSNDTTPSLHLGVGGPVVGWLTEPLGWITIPGGIENWHPKEQGEWTRLSPTINLTKNHGQTFFVKTASLKSPPPVLPTPQRVATGHHFVLHLDDGTPFARFYCNPMEILSEEHNRVKVRVRGRKDRWILEGWVQGSVAERGGACGPRVIIGRFGYSVAHDGTESPPAPVIPDGYVRLQAPEPPPRLNGAVWLQHWDRQQKKRVCQQWSFRPTKNGVVIERQYREQFGSGQSVMTEFIPLMGGPLDFQKYAKGQRRKWIRRPKDNEGMPGLRGACGTIWQLQIVGADSEKIAWITGGDWQRSIIAYHPNDLSFWFLTKEACETTSSSSLD